MASPMRRYHTWIIAVLLTATVQKGSSECSMTDPCADQLGQAKVFQEPTQLSSKESSWSMTLTVDISTVSYNWLELKRRLYNGAVAGPTISVKRGDQLTLNLINNLSPDGNDLGRPLDMLNHPNTTNFHTHGLHISSKPPQDDVLTPIEPLKQHQYVYQIHKDNSPGTYWYHAHWHGSSCFQVAGGMSGILIVEDKESDMPAELSVASCPENCDKDIQLLFQPILMFDQNSRGFGKLQEETHDYRGFRTDGYVVAGGGTLTEWLSDNVNYYTTNGLFQPTLAMSTGEMYRFRLVNAGGETPLELYVTDSAGNPTLDCDTREIAIDGVYLSKPHKMHDGQTMVNPAGRVDWLVKCNVPGVYKLRSFANASNDLSMGVIYRYTGDLMTLDVSGPAAESAFPTTLPSRPSNLRDLRNVPEADIEGRFVVEFDPDSYINRQLWMGPTNYRYKMTLGKVQEWHILNTDNMLSHTLHIHVNHFQVISYNNYTGSVAMNVSGDWYLASVSDMAGKCYFQYEKSDLGPTPQAFDAGFRETRAQLFASKLHYLGHNIRFAEDKGGTLGYARLGDWMDVLMVPPLANITIRFVPADFDCYVIVHCHILAHEDTGMMMVLKIVKEGESTAADVKSGGAYPGTCGECDRYPFNNDTTLCHKKGT